MSDLFNLPEGVPPLSVRVEKARAEYNEALAAWESEDSDEGGLIEAWVDETKGRLARLEAQLLAETIRERR